MKKNILRAILIIMLFGTFIMIFNFSNQDGKTSSGVSRTITEATVGKIPSVQKMEEIKKVQILDRAEHIIRKIAHFSIYTLVGFLSMALLSTYNLKQAKRIIISLVIGIAYAISDEIHQLFILERSSQITDVFIDSLGVTFGILILILTFKMMKNVKKCGKI